MLMLMLMLIIFVVYLILRIPQFDGFVGAAGQAVVTVQIEARTKKYIRLWFEIYLLSVSYS